MSFSNSNIKKYPLLPYSRLVYDLTRWMPQVYSFNKTVRIIDGAMAISKWQETIAKALNHHPVFRSCINWQGKQFARPQKYVLCGRFHHFSFRINGDDLLIEACLNRILGDGRSIEILIEDISHAYRGEPLSPDDYWGYLEYVELQKQSKHYADSKAWLINEFSDMSVPVRPTLDKPLWTLFPPKAGQYMEDYTDKKEAINELSETKFLSLDGFFSLCTALAIAEYCKTDDAALTWAYEGRERIEEQRVYGSLHRDIPFHIRKSKIGNRDAAIREARNQIRFGIAHSDFPFTLTAPYNKRWNYAVNVLRVADEQDLLKYLPAQVEFLPSSPQKYAYSLLDVEILEREHLYVNYRYSASHYKSQSIKKFAALVRKYAEWLLEDEK